MATQQAIVGAMPFHPVSTKGKGKSKDQKRKNSKDQQGKWQPTAESLEDAGQTQEPEAETGSHELGASACITKSSR